MATPHGTRSHTSLPVCPCPSLGSPGIPGSHRASSQAGALLNHRAPEKLISQHCSGTGECSQLHGGVRKPSSTCSPGSHRLGQGTGAQFPTVPCHRNALPTSIARADLTWLRSESLLGSALVRVEPWRRTALSLPYCFFHSGTP